jgi:hypothetical protein
MRPEKQLEVWLPSQNDCREGSSLKNTQTFDPGSSSSLLLVATLELIRGGVVATHTVGFCVVLTGALFASMELVPSADHALEILWDWSRALPFR